MNKNIILVILIIFSNAIFITYPLYSENIKIRKDILEIRDIKHEKDYINESSISQYEHLEEIKNLLSHAGFVKISERIEVGNQISLELKFKCDFADFQKFINLADEYNSDFFIEEGFFNFDNNGRESYLIIKHFGEGI